jgi:hypothetical protein
LPRQPGPRAHHLHHPASGWSGSANDQRPSRHHPDHGGPVTQPDHRGPGLRRRPILGHQPQAGDRLVRAATHRACDRVVFDLNGLGRVGYLVRYVPTVHADPSDRPIPVAGAATLQVTIQAPDFRESGHQAWRTPWQLGQRLAGGGTTLREVRFAGTFEHVTTFAVGVRTRRPFRVLVLPDSANHITRLVVDVAH